MTAYRFQMLILIGLLGTPPLHAQHVTSPTEEARALVPRLTVGAYETVWLVDGSRVTGTFTRMTDDVIEITPRTRFPVPARKIAFGDIQSIRQGRGDPLMNGALWGGLTSGVGSLIVAQAVLGCDGCHWASASAPLGIMGLFGAIGASVGAGIDALIGGNGQVIYSRSTPPAVTVAPFGGRDRKGVLLSIGF